MNEMHDISPFIEPVYYFCLKRLSNHTDAEDLAGEILLYTLEGLNRYDVHNLEAWVWRIAHNRYARFIHRRKNEPEMVYDDCEWLEDDRDFIDEITVADEYEPVFRSLHTLSAEYRNIMVDHYIGGMSVKDIANKYALTETTVKWRLNSAREKIRKRIGEEDMERIYKRINWDTTTCNGAMNPDEYLHSQIARAICEAAYEKPLTVDEISLKTGIPALYIEDELPKLIYGDAVRKIGNKYATDFIVVHLSDVKSMEKRFEPLVSQLADYYEDLMRENEVAVRRIGFIGCDRGMEKLGYIAVPLSLRGKISEIKNRIKGLENGPFPPRKDGGYGWFVVQETSDDTDIPNNVYETGDNVAGCDSGSEGDRSGCIHYYHIRKYFDAEIYHRGGTRWLTGNSVVSASANGIIPDGLITEDDIVRLVSKNLIIKEDNGYALNFPLFSKEEFESFKNLFLLTDSRQILLIENLICEIRNAFASFVPKRLDSQINQWVSCYAGNIIGYTIEELITRGVLEKPDKEIPMTNGVFFVAGEYQPI